MDVIELARSNRLANRTMVAHQKGKLHWFPARSERHPAVTVEMIFGVGHVLRTSPYMRSHSDKDIYHFEEQELLLLERVRMMSSSTCEPEVVAIMQEYLVSPMMIEQVES